MKKLIEALHVIKDECMKHYDNCGDCPMFCEKACVCAVTDLKPNDWEINDEIQRALL